MHHVLVTTGQLIPTLGKLLICGLDTYVPPDNIYSARNETKESCFRLVERKFGPRAEYCVIGKRDGPLQCRPGWKPNSTLLFMAVSNTWM